MATRSSKRALNVEIPQLSHLESLLIAQGVWEMGTNTSTWPAIAKILSKHPLVTRSKSFFTAQVCHAMYDHLMREAGLESNEESSVPQSATNLALAKKYFQLRHDELRELIIAEENAFKTVLKEIEDIKAGKWDTKTKASLPDKAVDRGLPAAVTETETGGDEPFGGSDLSGVTEASSPSFARGDSETPTLKPNNEAVLGEASGSTTEQEPSALAENNDMEVEEGTGPEEAPMEDVSGADQPLEMGPADEVTAQVNEKDNEPLRQEEEEEEEEEATASKSEEEETDREGGPAKESSIEEPTEVKEHKPEEEEEEEDVGEPPQEDEDQEVEEVLPQEDEANTPPVSSEEPETLEQTEQPAEEAEEEAASDEEPARTTRRSTRNKSSAAAGPTTRGTRRQGRTSEPDIQSPAVIEGERADMDETKTETSQEEDQASSPAPAEPVNIRRSKRKGSGAENVESPRDRKRQRDESEPVDDDEPGPSSTGQRRRRGDRSEEQVALKRFQNVIGMLHSQISQHRNGNIFHNPIRTVEAPDYHDIVKRPMDLKTIKGRVKDGLIANSLEYQRDIFLMFANAMMYNRPGSDVYHMAEDMMHESEVHIKAFRQTEGLVRGRP